MTTTEKQIAEIERFANEIIKQISVMRNMANETSGIYAIKNIVADYFCVEPEELNEVSRRGEIKTYRQIAMYFYYINKDKLKISNAKIGELFSDGIHKFDHATINNSVASIKNASQFDKSFRVDVISLEEKINEIFKKS